MLLIEQKLDIDGEQLSSIIIELLDLIIDNFDKCGSKLTLTQVSQYLNRRTEQNPNISNIFIEILCAYTYSQTDKRFLLKFTIEEKSPHSFFHNFVKTVKHKDINNKLNSTLFTRLCGDYIFNSITR